MNVSSTILYSLIHSVSVGVFLRNTNVSETSKTTNLQHRAVRHNSPAISVQTQGGTLHNLTGLALILPSLPLRLSVVCF